MTVFVLGIDLGTQGARAIVSDLAGRVAAEGSCPLPADQVAPTRPGWFEQDPRWWREAVFEAVRGAVARFRAARHAPDEIGALSATGTSGTLCLADEAGEPVGSAIMYSDTRADAVAAVVRAAGAETAAKLGIGYNASYALCKLTWLQRVEPERLERARWYLSPTDMVLGWLSGTWGVSDWTNALKWGYDVADLEWPGFIAQGLGLNASKLPHVRAPGTVMGRVTPLAAEATGLAAGTPVVAGATDGTASQLASGAVDVGDWNSTLGTTLVLKGVSRSLLRDPLGRLYCHRHPDGAWLPGAASSTGADCLAQRFSAADLPELNRAALTHSPTDLIVYPLARRGERFPFLKPDATGFSLGASQDRAVTYAAHLEGLAYVERLCYQVVAELGATMGDAVFVAGGGTGSEAGLQIRADVLGRRLIVPEVPSGAMGAAILAARGAAYGTVTEAARGMVRRSRVVEPRRALQDAYDGRYARFVAACRERGYVP
jgi:D-ribulokinase